MGVAKRKRRSVLEEALTIVSTKLGRNKRSILMGPSGATVNTSSTDYEMVGFMTRNGATDVIVTWTEYVII